MSQHTPTCEIFDKNPDYHYECLHNDEGPVHQTIAWTCLYEFGRRNLLKRIKDKIRKVVQPASLEEEAEDILSEQIEKLAKEIVRGDFENRRPIKTSFKSILARKCDLAAIDKFRSSKNKPIITNLIDKLRNFLKNEEKPDVISMSEILEKARRKLNPLEQQVIALDIEGKSNQEIALLMGIPIQRVYALRSSAINKIREMFN